MDADSRRGPLPLADAMLEWSDSSLIEAIRTGEALSAAVGRGHREHFTLTDLRTKRRSPARPLGFIASFSPTAALERAWEALYSVWRFKIERGEISLAGNNTLQVLEPGTIVLPSTRAAELKFDPAAGAVFLGASTYVGVTATRMTSGLGAAGDAAPVVLELPIADALIAWGDTNLVARFRELEARKAYFQELEAQRRKPSLGRVIAIHRSPEELSLPIALGAAHKALIEDIRKKIERGRLGIAGVQTFPLRETERKPIPGLWASQFLFDVEADKVNVVEFNRTTRAYIAVVVTGPDLSAEGKGTAVTPDETSPSRRYGGLAPPRLARAKKKRGRKPSEGHIEAALRVHWEEMKRFAANPDGTYVWTEVARALCTRMQGAQRKDRSLPVFKVNTVRKHLPDIYRSVLTEKAAEEKSGQKITSGS